MIIMKEIAIIQSPIEIVFQSKERIRITKVLSREGELNIAEIARRVHLNHNSVKLHLKALVKAGVLEEKKVGQIKTFRFRIEDIRARVIKNLFEVWEPAGN